MKAVERDLKDRRSLVITAAERSQVIVFSILSSGHDVLFVPNARVAWDAMTGGNPVRLGGGVRLDSDRFLPACCGG